MGGTPIPQPEVAMYVRVSPRWRRVAALCVFGLLALPSMAGAQPPPSQTSIEKLLKDDWEIAGYVSAWENRSLILFKHKDHKYLVQCSVLIDVLRTPRLITYCYEIH
jgi:hypothetical protein